MLFSRSFTRQLICFATAYWKLDHVVIIYVQVGVVSCSLYSYQQILHDRTHSFLISSSVDMATTSAVLAPARVSGAVVSCGSKTRQRTPKVVYIGGMSSYGGLKAHNNVVSLGLPASTEQCFANVVSSLKAHGKGRTGGGALSSTCNDAAEIFKIAAIMNGLVLIGVAVGFVLLRIEASLEESEQ
ncbi:hypothetical protein DITRI_Ditri03aG0199700 [Diplodiscus trichospermus]